MDKKRPLEPAATLLVKLGSIAVHAEEMIEPRGHPLDLEALRALLADPEVIEWRLGMDKMAFLSVMR
jgi:hypothetical protein